MKYKLPFQPLPADLPVIIWPLPYPGDDFARNHHRHRFFMLLWVTQGTGKHQVNFQDQELRPGRVLFIQEGQAHRVIAQPERGWLILFKPDIFGRFLRHYPAEEQHGLFDYMDDRPYVDLDRPTADIFSQIMPLLFGQSKRDPADPLTADYIHILLHAANRLHQPLHPRQVHPEQAEQIRQLKMLIEQHYLSQRHAPFYAGHLHLPARKLNALASQLTGHVVDELVEWRIIAEAEALLGGSNFSIKEVAFQLGFVSQTHFAYFFRKRKHCSPKAFRAAARKGF